MTRWEDPDTRPRRHSARVTGGAVIAALFVIGVVASTTGSTSVRLLHGALAAFIGGALPIGLMWLAERRRNAVPSRRADDLA